jgi:hypothetical protein
LVLIALAGLTQRISKNILVSLPSLSAAANRFGFIADFPAIDGVEVLEQKNGAPEFH